MFCWFYAAQAHISCGATALWMELVECFPNKLGKLLCANSCETNDKIICHTNQCTNSRSSILIYYYFFKKNSVPYSKILHISGSFCESVIITTVPIACLISGTVPEPTMCHVQYYAQYIQDYTYTCYVAPATFDNNKSDDSNITRGARMQNRHIVQQQGGVRTTYTMRAAAELSFVVRPMIDGLHYKLATIGTPSPKRARKKTSSIFQS